MRVSSHQPNFIPWAGFFYKIAISDAFIFADDVAFSRKSYINRNRIKSPDGPVWLTIPVKKAPLGTPINKTEISNIKEIDKLLKVIRSNYTRAPYFEPFFEKLAGTVLGNGNNLADINAAVAELIMEELNITTQVFYTSHLDGIKGGSTDRIVSICRVLGAETYISGFGGRNYQSEDIMQANGIECEVYDFRHPVYHQLWGKFVPNLSVIDLLFNCGSDAGNILRNR